MEGYPMDTLWDTMWIPYGVHCGDLGTLGGTLRTPGSSRETRERLERDSRETRERLKTVSTTPKAWIPKSEKSEMRTDTTHSSSKSSSNKRKSDTKGEGGK